MARIMTIEGDVIVEADTHREAQRLWESVIGDGGLDMEIQGNLIIRAGKFLQGSADSDDNEA